MELIGGLVLLFVLVSLMLVRVVGKRTHQSRHIDNLDTEDELNQEIRTRLSRYLALFGLRFTSGMAFAGIVILFLMFTNEARLTGNPMDDLLPLILISIGIVAGILGTIGIVRIYRRL